MKNIFKRVGAFALTLILTLTSINLSGIFTEKAYAANTWTINGKVFDEIQVTGWKRSRGNALMYWKDDGHLWDRMNSYTPIDSFSWPIGCGGPSDWPSRASSKTARTIRLQGKVKLDKDCWGRELNQVHFSVNSSHKDTYFHVDDGYWILAYPECLAGSINNSNFLDYWVIGCMWHDAGYQWDERMTEDLNHRVTVLPSTNGTTKILDNASTAFRRGFQQAKGNPNFDGTFIIDVWYFEINSGGSADKFIFGINLDDNTPITESRGVTYKGGSGASGSVEPTWADKDSTVKIKSNEFTKTGYEFQYWDGSNGNRYDPGDNYKLTDSLVCTANWKAKDYTITFNQNKPSNMTPTITGRTDNSTVKVTYDSTANNNVTTCATSPTGWTFNGWYTAASGGTQVYDASGKYNSSATSYWSDGKWHHDGNVTLYAHWTANNYTLTFSPSTPSNSTHAVSLSPTSKTVAYDSQIGSVPTPSLKGWTLQKNGSDHWYIDSNYINSSTYWRYIGSKTAYVKWKENEYNIYYDKGLTSETIPTNITGSLDRDTNIQSTSTNRPYKRWKYDNNVTFAAISPVKGRKYTLKYNINKPVSVPKQKINNTANPTTVADTIGNLASQNKWQISGQDSDITTNLIPTMSDTIAHPNYKDADNASVVATALWSDETLNNFTKPTLAGWNFVGWYDNPEGNDSTAVSNTTDMVREINTTTNVSPNTSVNNKGNINYYTVRPKTTEFNETMYARWQRTITLTFNMNGGQYQGSPNNVVLTGIYYTNADGYNFNILNGLTPASLPNYEQQIEKIDAYGTYDSNGKNNKYAKDDADGTEYRFLGWSLSPTATEPDSDFIVYSGSHKSTYRLYDNTTLYAVWEPILSANISIDRTLGNLTFKDGTHPKTSVSGVIASDGLQELSVIIKPGEQGKYSITTTGSDNIYIGSEFDTRITDIYTHPGTWTDNLNPSTLEDLILGQGHGLNRAFKVSSVIETRKFYIPQYLGTPQSYSTSIGVTEYTFNLLIQQDSYYYRYLGTKEEIPVQATIYIVADKVTDPSVVTPVISVLDELRTKLRIRLH